MARDENDVDQLAQEAEPEGAELHEPHGGVAQIEPVDAKHSQEDGEQEGRVEAVAVPGMQGERERETQVIWVVNWEQAPLTSTGRALPSGTSSSWSPRK